LTRFCQCAQRCNACLPVVAFASGALIGGAFNISAEALACRNGRFF
jgi:hypothetical protein